MGGDLDMLNEAASAWWARLGGGANPSRASWWLRQLRRAFHSEPTADESAATAAAAAAARDGVAVSAALAEPLCPADIPLGCVDFHCSRVLDAALAQPATRAAVAGVLARSHGPVDPVAEVCKTAMWQCSASLTTKRDWGGGERLEAAAADTAPLEAAVSPSQNLPRTFPDTAPLEAAVSPSGPDKLHRDVWEALAPACRSFASALIGTHFVGEAAASRSAAPAPPPLAASQPRVASPHPTLAGQFTVLDFVSPAEEEALLTFLDGADRWRNHGGNVVGAGVKWWGVKTDLNARTVTEHGHPPMPAEFDFLRVEILSPRVIKR